MRLRLEIDPCSINDRSIFDPLLLCFSLPIQFSPNPTSSATISHFISCKDESRFRSRLPSSTRQAKSRWGWGSRTVEEYEEYDLASTTCNMHVYYSDGDWAAAEKDCQ